MIREIREHTLYFDGCDTTALAKKYGTPLYVYSENDIVSRFDELKRDFLNKYENTRVAYAAKAFGCKATIVMPIGRIIVDGLSELSLIEEICAAKNKKMNILFRVTPGVKSDSHDYIVTGKKDSKFGIPLDDDVLLPLVRQAQASEWVDFLGFHFHVGSQLFSNESHLQALDIVLNIVKKVTAECGCSVRELNLGGGFGITYTNEQRRPYSYFLNPMMERIETFFEAEHMKRPAVVIEPGRSIVGEAGITLYTIGSIKEIPGIRKYVSVDGGMTDNIRPALYQAVYDAVIANKADAKKEDTVTICGKCCEGGDVLAVFSTGAYGYSMASNYNKNPIPPVVFVKDGSDRLVVKGQSYEDMLANEL